MTLLYHNWKTFFNTIIFSGNFHRIRILQTIWMLFFEYFSAVCSRYFSDSNFVNGSKQDVLNFTDQIEISFIRQYLCVFNACPSSACRYRVLKSARRSGIKSYLSNVWYLLHLVVTVCSSLTIILFIVRLLLVKWQVQFYNENPERFTSFAVIGMVRKVVGFTVACKLLPIH